MNEIIREQMGEGKRIPNRIAASCLARALKTAWEVYKDILSAVPTDSDPPLQGARYIESFDVGT